MHHCYYLIFTKAGYPYKHGRDTQANNMPNQRDLSAQLPDLENKTHLESKQDVIRDWWHLYDHRLNWTFRSLWSKAAHDDEFCFLLPYSTIAILEQVGSCLVVHLWQKIHLPGLWTLSVDNSHSARQQFARVKWFCTVWSKGEAL